MRMLQPTTEEVWCDGGPWNGEMIDVPKGHNVITVPEWRTDGDESVHVEHHHQRFGNIALYEGWRYAE